MIECFATVHVNRPDLTQRLLSSIDFPVKHLLIIHNGTDSLHELKIPGFVVNYDQIVNGENKGVSGGWNQCLDFAFVQHDLNSVLIVGNDIEWHVGDLSRIHQTVVDFPDADFVFGNHSFSNFLVKRSGWEKCGWFWEELYPAYWEDSEMWQRIKNTNTKAVHAAGLHAKHEGSATIKSDPVLRAKNEAAFQHNAKLYADRWGYVGKIETFTTPYNKGGDIKEWSLSEARRKHPYFRANG